MNYSGLGGGSLVTALGAASISGTGVGAAIAHGILPRTGGHIAISVATYAVIFLITWGLFYTGLSRLQKHS